MGHQPTRELRKKKDHHAGGPLLVHTAVLRPPRRLTVVVVPIFVFVFAWLEIQVRGIGALWYYLARGISDMHILSSEPLAGIDTSAGTLHACFFFACGTKVRHHRPPMRYRSHAQGTPTLRKTIVYGGWSNGLGRTHKKKHAGTLFEAYSPMVHGKSRIRKAAVVVITASSVFNFRDRWVPRVTSVPRYPQIPSNAVPR